MPTMLTLPWRWTRQTRPNVTVIFASRFDGAGVRTGWKLFVGGIRLRRAVLHSPGALGVSVRAHPQKGRYYTLSMWDGEASLLAFAQRPDHQAAARDLRESAPAQGILLSRQGDSQRPRWKETRAWLAAAQPGPYHQDPALTAES